MERANQLGESLGVVMAVGRPYVADGSKPTLLNQAWTVGRLGPTYGSTGSAPLEQFSQIVIDWAPPALFDGQVQRSQAQRAE